MTDTDLLVLVIGKGAREHALAWQLSQSRSVKHVFVFPGNAGTHEVAACNNTAGISSLEGVSSSEYHDLAKRAKELGIGLVVVGPDDDVVNGIEEFFRKGQGAAIDLYSSTLPK